MRDALPAYLERLWRDGNHAEAVVAAAEKVAGAPWDVIRFAGLLARCVAAVADKDIGLTAALKVVAPEAQSTVAIVAKGAKYPTLLHADRRERGAYDTPVDMARRLVSATLANVEGTARSALDPACGTGAFLLALTEAGVKEVHGTDIDSLALRIAQLAVPKATLALGDALRGGMRHDVVVGNPPFVPPEHQDKRLRDELKRRFPWLQGRFDLVVPFAAVAAERARAGGAVGLVLPAPVMVQPYAAVLRKRWVQRHRIAELSGPHAFPGAAVHVMLVVLRIDRGPGPVPAFGMPPDELLRLDNVPLNPDLMPGDVELVERIRSRSIPLGELCLVDTGVVAHVPGSTRERLIFDEPGPNRVKYADAKEFFAGKHRWLEYKPDEMHRAKRPEMFEANKIVVQRLRGDGPVRAALDTQRIYVGHTCTVVIPRPVTPNVPLERLLELIRSPVVNGITRIEAGDRLDLYPRDVAKFPVPKKWLHDPTTLPEKAWGIGAKEVAQLMRFARR